MENDQTPPKRRSVTSVLVGGFRLIGRVLLTFAVIAGAGYAVQFGSGELARRAEAAPLPEAAQLIPVSASPLTIVDGYNVTRAFVGQVEPQKTVSLSFELSGRLQAIGADEGDWVTEGQVLASQDLSLLTSEETRLQASRTAAEAQLRFAMQTVERNEELTRRGFATQAGLDEALSRQDELHARIAEIDASLENVAIRVAKSQIIAPFDGRVTERLVDGGEPLGAGQRVFGLVELRKPQVRIGVPLDLTEAQLEAAEIEIGADVYPAALVTLRPDIDPVTRTRTAIFEIDTETQPAFGQTARLMVAETIMEPGLWLPTTSLQEGLRGQWTILTVDPEQTVRAASVEILHAESDRVYVRAAFPDGTMLINEGPQRVTVGQQVITNNTL